MKTAEECEAIKYRDNESRERLGGVDSTLRVRTQKFHLLSSFPRQGPGKTVIVQ